MSIAVNNAIESSLFIICSCGKCPTSFQLVEGLMSRPRPEASTSWKLVGHCAARFSFFQGAGHEGLLRKIVLSPAFRRDSKRVFITNVSSDRCERPRRPRGRAASHDLNVFLLTRLRPKRGEGAAMPHLSI